MQKQKCSNFRAWNAKQRLCTVAMPVGHNEPLLIAMKRCELHGLVRTRPLEQHHVRLSFMASQKLVEAEQDRESLLKSVRCSHVIRSKLYRWNSLLTFLFGCRVGNVRAALVSSRHTSIYLICLLMDYRMEFFSCFHVILRSGRPHFQYLPLDLSDLGDPDRS